MRWTAAVLAAGLCACSPMTQTPDAAIPLCPDGVTPVPDGGVCPVPEPGCDAGSQLLADGGCAEVGWSACPDGFVKDPGGWDCAPLTAGSCDAGTSPQIGSVDCAPVGWSVCPTGFVADPSGWGCAAVLPAQSCSGATRESLGSSTCVPVGDCAAAFPPAAATLFVDDSFTAGQLDASHFARISDALTAAPAGATIAVEAGSYAEALAPARAVTVIGRCAAQVTLQAPAGQPAVAVIGAQALELKGFTLRGSLLGVRGEMGAKITVRASVLEANLRSGLQVLDPATQLTLEEVVVRGTLADPATSSFGQGLAASYGAQVTMTDVAFVSNRETAVFLDRAGTHAALTRVVILGTLPRASTGKLGWGIGVQGGAQLDLDRSVVSGNTATGLAVVQTPTKATVKDSIVSDTLAGKDNNGQTLSFNVAVLLGGSLDWTGGGILRAAQTQLQVQASTAALRQVTIRGVTGGVAIPAGVVASQGSQLTIDHSAVLDSIGGGIDGLGAGTSITLDHVRIDGVAADPLVPESGIGLRAQDKAQVAGSAVVVQRASATGAIAISGGNLALIDSIIALTHDTPVAGAKEGGNGVVAQTTGTATVLHSLIEKNTLVGAYATGADSKLTVSQSVIRGTALDAMGEYGQGAVAEHGAILELTEVAVIGNHTGGVQVSDPNTQLKLMRVTVRGTLPNGAGTRGRGANADFGGTLTATDSAFVDNQQVGIFSYQSGLVLDRCLVRGTRTDPDGRFGNGVEVLTDSVLKMTGGALHANAGIGAVFAEGAGVLDGVRISRHAVGLHSQDGSQVEELAAPPATLGARQVVVTPATAFVGNETKFGGGSVPLPPP